MRHNILHSLALSTMTLSTLSFRPECKDSFLNFCLIELRKSWNARSPYVAKTLPFCSFCHFFFRLVEVAFFAVLFWLHLSIFYQTSISVVQDHSCHHSSNTWQHYHHFNLHHTTTAPPLSRSVTTITPMLIIVFIFFIIASSPSTIITVIHLKPRRSQ